MSWSPPLPEGYNDGHRAFLQAFMARGTLTLEEAKPIIAAILTARGDEDAREVSPNSVSLDQFESFVAHVREAVSPLDLDIKSTIHQTHKLRIWALINTHSDPSTQLATTHTPDEIAFIKRLLDAMFETYNTPRMEVMAVNEPQATKLARPARNRQSNGDGADAVNGSSNDKGLKASAVLALLPTLVAEGWLEHSNSGFYSLSPRALVELQAWLLASYNDPDAEDGDWQRIKTCGGCKEVITVGQRCGNRDCLVRIHEICQESYWASRGVARDAEKKCPKCSTVWTGKHYVGEGAVTQTEAFQRSARARGGGRRSDLVDSIIAQEEAAGEEDLEDVDEDEEEE